MCLGFCVCVCVCVCMCGFCNVWMTEYMGFVMCGYVYVRVFYCVDMCMNGFFITVSVFVCANFVMYGCLYV